MIHSSIKTYRLTITVALLALAASSLLAGPLDVVERETARVEPNENGWSFRLAMYGWMQSLDGTIGVRGIESEIDLQFKDILENLNIGAMGVLEVRYQRWGFMADMVYADLGGSADIPFNIFFNRADYEQKQFTGNFIASYCFVDNPRFKLDGYAGARVNYLDSEITLVGNLLPLPPATPPFVVANRGFGGSKTWVDPIVGTRFQATISGPFFVRAGGDIGGFGVS